MKNIVKCGWRWLPLMLGSLIVGGCSAAPLTQGAVTDYVSAWLREGLAAFLL